MTKWQESRPDPMLCLAATFAASGIGLARFYVKTDDRFTGSEIKLDFEVDLSTVSGATHGLEEQFGMFKAGVNLKVRNNSNVTLGDVLAGTAVFVYDIGANGKSKGEYRSEDKDNGDEQKRFYFVQELFNQV
ncbi:MAG: hypothetical protein HY265_03450, partial [Deltaproteobacteria bacterium]|nr:hypothetical protein [Deltaproteobacteria bacterium]